jgi:carbon monoxide dehydrogenase subunit G
MEITNSFTVDAPIAEAWELLTNIPEITPCLPGAKLTDETDGVYSGGVKVKVGPVTAEYKGSAEFVEKDDATYKAVISGKGRDTRGAGNAQALITAQMTAVGNKTEVDIHTDLKVSGKVAQFGRGVMQDVSTKLLGQFAECLETKIGEPDTIEEIAAAGAAGTAVDASVSAAPSPAHAVPSAESEDDSVLDLGDIGIGGVLLKRYGAAAGVTALILVILMWMTRRRRSL